MASIKKNKIKYIAIPLAVVIVIGACAGGYTYKKTEGSKPTVKLSTITTGNISESVTASGQIVAGSTVEYKASTVATPKEVFVKVGDKVKKDQLIASFETEEMDAQVASLQTTFDNANASYISAARQQKIASENLKSINKQIKELNKEAKKYEATTTTTTKKTTTRLSSSSTTNRSGNRTTEAKLKATTSKTSTTTTTSLFTMPVEYDDISEAIADIAKSLTSITDDVKTMSAALQIISDAISAAIESGDYNADSIADKVGEAMTIAIRQGVIDETQLIIDSGVAVDMMETAVRSIDWNSIGAGMLSTDSVKSASITLQLAVLNAEKELFTSTSDMTTVNTKKQVRDASYSALEAVKKARDELKVGWIASIDGTVTSCSLEQGVQTSALATGITIENLDKMSVRLSLSEYDVHKISVGMSCEIKSAYGSYTGEVTSIAPTATSGSSTSALDSFGSMVGVDGLSSLTSSSAGVETMISVNAPDSNIIAGFNADVTIKTSDNIDVVTVPIESIILQKDGSFVYKYDESTNSVTKTKIETGAVNSSTYEVKDGLKVGDKIIKTPSSDYEEETFEVKVKK